MVRQNVRLLFDSVNRSTPPKNAEYRRKWGLRLTRNAVAPFVQPAHRGAAYEKDVRSRQAVRQRDGCAGRTGGAACRVSMEVLRSRALLLLPFGRLVCL